MTDRLLTGDAAGAKSRAADTVVGESDPMGKIVLVELPPGAYEFDAYVGADPSLVHSDDVLYFSPPGFKYRFKVSPAEVNYLGDLSFALAQQIGYLGMGMNTSNAHSYAVRIAGVHFRILDQHERDASLFATQFPTYSQEEMIWCWGCEVHDP